MAFRSKLLALLVTFLGTIVYPAWAVFIFDANELTKAFGTLGITDRSVSDSELKKAYTNLLMKYHPDRPGGDLEKAQKINAAFDYIQASREQGYSEARMSSGASGKPVGEAGLGIPGKIATPYELYNVLQVFENDFGYVLNLQENGGERNSALYWRPKSAANLSRLLVGHGLSGRSIPPGLWIDLKTNILDFRLPAGRIRLEIQGKQLKVGRHTFKEADVNTENREAWRMKLLGGDASVAMNDAERDNWEVRQYYIYRGPDAYIIIAAMDYWYDFKKKDSYRMFSVPYEDLTNATEYEVQYDSGNRSVNIPANGSHLHFYLGVGEDLVFFDPVLRRHLGVVKQQLPTQFLTIKSSAGDVVGKFAPVSAEELSKLSLIKMLGDKVAPPPILSTPLDPDFFEFAQLGGRPGSCTASMLGPAKVTNSLLGGGSK